MIKRILIICLISGTGFLIGIKRTRVRKSPLQHIEAIDKDIEQLQEMLATSKQFPLQKGEELVTLPEDEPAMLELRLAEKKRLQNALYNSLGLQRFKGKLLSSRQLQKVMEQEISKISTTSTYPHPTIEDSDEAVVERYETLVKQKLGKQRQYKKRELTSQQQNILPLCMTGAALAIYLAHTLESYYNTKNLEPIANNE